MTVTTISGGIIGTIGRPTWFTGSNFRIRLVNGSEMQAFGDGGRPPRG